jgi:hypothetical protein
LSTNTTKLQLLKADPSELVDVTAQIDNAFDKIDSLLPTQLITSLTRPGAPFDGQLIKETDTGAILQWDLASASWLALVQARNSAGAFKNAIRNGDFSIAQRGVGPFVATGVVGIDGWQQDFINGSMSTSQVAAVLGNPAQLDGAKFGLQSVVVGTAAAGDYASHSCKIESVLKFAGKKVTLTFKSKANAGTPKIGIEVVQSFGIAGAPSGVVLTAIQAVTLNVTETEYSITFTVPSIAGKTLGTDGKDYLAIIFWESSGATNNTRASGIGVQSFTLTLFDVQLELGASKTAFERLQPQAQLAWCQRYLVNFITAGSSVYLATGFCWSATNAVLLMPLPVTMRNVPSLSFNAVASWSVLSGSAASIALTVLVIGTLTLNGIRLDATTAGGLTLGQGTILQSGGAATLTLSAEL